MFHWSTEVIQMLEQSNTSGAPALVHKKHRLDCYLLEKFFDLLLGKKSVSSNPGFESFVGQWTKNEIDVVREYSNKNQCYPSQLVVSFFSASLLLFPNGS